MRFTGKAPVRVYQGGETYVFHTRDYNELGMHMRAEDHPQPVLAPGDAVAGDIGSVRETQVDFEGVVVRAQHESGGLYYAVRIPSPPKRKND